MATAETLVIILHFGSIEDTLACLDSLRRSVVSPFDVFVVNNGPDKGVESILKASHPDVICHNAGLETGFAAGNNMGLRFSLKRGYHYSLVLNNDTIAEQDFLQPLTQIMEMDRSIAMAGPAMYFYHNKKQLWSCGGKINWWSGRLGSETTPEQMPSRGTDVDYLPGACILVRNAALAKIGLMSEEYFLGMEEADWAIRARNVGFRVVAQAKAILLHKVGISSWSTPEVEYNGFRNRFLFLRRQYPLVVSLLLSCCILLNGLRKNSLARRLRWRAFKDHLKYRDIRRSHLDAVRVEMKSEGNLEAR